MFREQNMILCSFKSQVESTSYDSESWIRAKPAYLILSGYSFSYRKIFNDQD